MTPLAPHLDSTLLRADARRPDVEALCAEAIEHGFASVCVLGAHVATAARLLAGSPVRAGTVVGFPFGALREEVKLLETRLALEDGAEEIDFPVDVGRLRDGDLVGLRNDVAAVVRAIHGGHAVAKVILETGLLTDVQKRAAAELAVDAGADFVKTSTGVCGPGATVRDVELLAEVAGDRARVKASGGIRDARTARAMVAAGASRIGTSSAAAIVAEEAGGSE